MLREGYSSPHDHLLAELGRVELLLHACVARFRRGSAAGSELRGLYIDDSDVDELLERAPGRSPWHGEDDGAELFAHAARLAQQVAARALASERAGLRLPLRELAHRFELTQLEMDVVLLALAPELDLRYERLYAYLQDDVTRKRPTVGLVLDLLCRTATEKWTDRIYFHAQSTLRRAHLIDVFAERASDRPPLLRRFIRIDERIVDYLLGHDGVERELSELVRLVVPRVQLDDVVAPTKLKARLQSALARAPQLVAEPQPVAVHPHPKVEFYPFIQLQGRPGVGRRMLAEALCGALGKEVLMVDAARFADLEHGAAKRSLALVMREARLRDACTCWTGCDALRQTNAEPARTVLFAQRWEHPGPHFFVGEQDLRLEGALANSPLLRLRLDRPDLQSRRQLWRTALPEADDVDLEEVAVRFQMSGQQIKAAAQAARNRALTRSDRDAPGLDDVIAGCREQANSKLRELALKINPAYTWDDIVLPSDQKDQLREICDFVRYRSVVFENWGFDRKLSLGKGLTAIFAGPSGTGKTMAAEIIARELNLDLYKIDLSSVVSKYIGDTEKNLSRVFREAEDSQGILFFDEADALFGKRSQVKDAHDRYANIEVSYLLQELDQHEGIVILATNLLKNMDEAFVRRVSFTVPFPFPDVDDRERLWSSLWPCQLPRDYGVDIPFLARQFKLSGGHVKNVLISAAFLAAADGGRVTMEHLIRGIKREYVKVGKPCVAADFGPWYSVLEERA